jgi:ATP-dependent DNA helicase DinG
MHSILGADGRLSEAIPGFAPREGQIGMAEAVQQALHERSVLVAEAGTGIGKTFAYLIPALLTEGKVIVSTGTKHLQDQLFRKDLPTLLQALDLRLNAVLLKGRSNYLCVNRLETALKGSRQRGHRDFRLLRELDDWRRITDSGDRVDFPLIAEDHILWPKVTSTTENCLGQECPDYGDCFVVKARKAAQEADMVVINHHLFCADLALKDIGFGELLPVANAIILDEAHQLPETAIRFFGDSLGSKQVHDLCRDVLYEARTEAPDMPDLLNAADNLPVATNRFRLTLGNAGQRAAWTPFLRRPAVQQAFQAFEKSLDALIENLELAAVRSQGLQLCFRRAQLLQAQTKELESASEDRVQWFETSRQGFVLNNTPYDVAETFQKHMERLDSAWIFTSATLAVGKDFGHFTQRMGLKDFTTGQWDSPFDYVNNVLMLLPEGLPMPSESGFLDRICKLTLQLVDANPGGLFFLFTSHRALQAAREIIEARVNRPLLVQGDSPRQALIDQFRQSGNAILLGTSGFWEGVDVQGNALTCVIIDKLPFASPGDPVMEARLAALRKKGANPFMDYQLPQAVIGLKQGAGRLIRGVADKGLLVLCDPRLRNKPYGRRFLESLPQIPITHDIGDACYFLEHIVNPAMSGKDVSKP